MCRRGGGRGTRTPDLYSAIVALSQLSYAPTVDKRSIRGWECERQTRLGNQAGSSKPLHVDAYEGPSVMLLARLGLPSERE